MFLAHFHDRSRCLSAVSLLALATPLLLHDAACAQAWNWPVIGFSIAGSSGSIGLYGSPPSTLMIGGGTILSPYLPGSTLGFYNPPVLGPNPLPIAEARIPGNVPGTSTPWSVRSELDGLSFIPKLTFQRFQITGAATWFFSVDRLSLGTMKGYLITESVAGQAHGDIYATTCPAMFLGPTAATIGNTLMADGDGLDLAGSPVLGLGLSENLHATDELDALAWHFQSSSPPNLQANLTIYSVDSATSAQFGFSGATIFWHLPSAVSHVSPPEPANQNLPAGNRVYVTPAQLGLTNADDVDALIVIENVWTGYQPSGGNVLPNWTVPGGGIYGITYPANPSQYPTTFVRDQVFFSITRNSPSVGSLDSNGIPIMPADILMAPANPTQSPLTPPTIVIAAEVMALRTDRLTFNLSLMDDIDALEVHQ